MTTSLATHGFNRALNHFDNAGKTIRQLKHIAENPVDYTCGTYTLISGLTHLFHGNVFLGVPLSAFGAMKLCELLTEVPELDFKELLEDAKAGIDIINTFQECEKESLERVDGHIVDLKDKITHCDEMLLKIEALASDGIEGIAEDKRQAHKKYSEAKEKHEKAIEQLQETKKTIIEAKKQLNKASLDTLLLLESSDQTFGDNVTKKDIQKKLQQFALLTQNTFTSLQNARKHHEEVQLQFDKSLKFLAEADKLHDEAFDDTITALGKAEEKFKEIKEEKGVCEDNIKIANEHIKDLEHELEFLKKLNQARDEVLDDVQDCIIGAQNQVVFGLKTVIIGGAGGGLAGFFIGGPAAAMAAAPAGCIAFHNRKRVVQVGAKAQELVLGKTPEVEKQPDAETKHLRFNFNSRSSGTLNWLRGKSSKTVGKIQISLGGKNIYNARINLNHKKPMRMKDMNKLSQTLIESVKKNPELKKEALEIIQELESIQIDRGEVKGTCAGVVVEKSPYFKVLKLRCEAIQ